jgi:hypothetical protein
MVMFISYIIFTLFCSQSSSTTKPTNTYGASMRSSSQKSQVPNNDGTDNQCPVCLMVFAAHMKSSDREEHVNEHYT